MKRTQAAMAGTAMILTGGALGLAGYLSYVFPRTIAIWQEEARALSAAETAMVRASQICTSFGIIILPVLLLLCLGALAWLTVALRAREPAQASA